VSFVLALFEEEEGWSAFVDPAVVSAMPVQQTNLAIMSMEKTVFLRMAC